VTYPTWYLPDPRATYLTLERARLNRKQERVAVPASNLAAVNARERRVDSLASVQTIDPRTGWRALARNGSVERIPSVFKTGEVVQPTAG
jgi:hypothetical protein